MMFSGSYEQGDVEFLLKQVEMDSTPLHRKEFLIQSGLRHYSEMLTRESPPDPIYLSLFDAAMDRNAPRLGRDIQVLAQTILAQHGQDICLVSLARAGTPIGVLLRRALLRSGVTAAHYSVSIIRGRGLDLNALDYILERHSDGSVVFVDGWTSKGGISRQLAASVELFNATRGTQLSGDMAVVADLCGHAGWAATSDDYLVPSAVLNGIVSGLVSRTILNSEVIGESDFHGCVVQQELAPFDRSRDFVNRVMRSWDESSVGESRTWKQEGRSAQQLRATQFLSNAMAQFDIPDPNLLKVGVGESTRALLRRVPQRLFIRTCSNNDVSHLLHLAMQMEISVVEDETMPYEAMVEIKRMVGKP
jgi:hypothetical protein